MNIRNIGIGLALMLIAIVGAVSLGATVTQGQTPPDKLCYSVQTSAIRWIPAADSCGVGVASFVDANGRSARYWFEAYRWGTATPFERGWATSFNHGQTHWRIFEGATGYTRPAPRTEADRQSSCRSLHRQRDFGALWFGQGCDNLGVTAYEASR